VENKGIHSPVCKAAGRQVGEIRAEATAEKDGRPLRERRRSLHYLGGGGKKKRKGSDQVWAGQKRGGGRKSLVSTKGLPRRKGRVYLSDQSQREKKPQQKNEKV